jgi:hypothetical protein
MGQSQAMPVDGRKAVQDRGRSRQQRQAGQQRRAAPPGSTGRHGEVPPVQPERRGREQGQQGPVVVVDRRSQGRQQQQAKGQRPGDTQATAQSPRQKQQREAAGQRGQGAAQGGERPEDDRSGT